MSRTPEMDSLRLVIQSTCTSPNDLISNTRLYEIMGLTTEREKARLRSRIGDLIKRGELVRQADGIYSYNPRATPKHDGLAFQKIWRTTRVVSPGFSYMDISLSSGVNVYTVMRYFKFLLQEDYISGNGKRGNTRLFRTTQKGKRQRETPFQPRAIRDPFKDARDAACRVVRLLMETNPYQPKVKQEIAAECRLILDRFETNGGEI